MKYAIYESHTVIRRIIVEADSESDAIDNWRMDIDCELDPYFYMDQDDYGLEDIKKIDEEE